MHAHASRPLVLLAAIAVLGAVALVAAPRAVTAQSAPGTLQGNLAPSGVSLALWSGGTPVELVATAEARIPVCPRRTSEFASVWKRWTAPPADTQTA